VEASGLSNNIHEDQQRSRAMMRQKESAIPFVLFRLMTARFFFWKSSLEEGS